MDDLCPDCGEPLEYDEVDIGVGIMRGNPGCPACGWTPASEHVGMEVDDDTDPINGEEDPLSEFAHPDDEEDV